MRKFLAFMLLASAAAPALAADGPGDRHGWSRPDRSERSDRSDRSDQQDSHQQSQSEHRERSSGADRPHFSGAEVEHARPALTEDKGGEARHISSGRMRMVQPDGGSLAPTTDAMETRELRVRERQHVAREGVTGPKIVTPEGGEGTLRQLDRPLPRVLRTRTPVVSNTPREGTQPPLRAEHRSRDRTHWSTHWRNDHKYNWHDWRRHHRSIFHLGLYYDPFGWDYRPYSIGWRLWPSYYSSRFWINDPWQYRLPYAPPGYRWVRYWDDAILVDTWTGEVVDVIYNFFW